MLTFLFVCGLGLLFGLLYVDCCLSWLFRYSVNGVGGWLVASVWYS